MIYPRLLAVLCVASTLFAQAPESRVLVVDFSKTGKNLNHSHLGANAQLFRSHYSMKKLLDQGDAFGEFLKLIGKPVLRMDGRSVYGWFSQEETQKLRDAEAKMRVLGRIRPEGAPGWRWFQPADYETLVKQYQIPNAPSTFTHKMNPPEVNWFSMEAFHLFCRRHGIRLFGAFNDLYYLDEASGQVVQFRDNPKYFEGAVKDAVKKLSWVVQNGYQDLYVGWEIGNESYTLWEPEHYSAYARKLASAVRKVQPGIQLAVPVIIRNTDDPAIKRFIAADPSRKNWFDWHEKMLPALGTDITLFSHLQVHVYGSASPYSANQKGLDTISAQLDKIPGTSHFRFFVTEWRYTGVGGTAHRSYRTGALWNAKFAMTLLAHPRVDESAAHEFLCTSGLGYWTPGKGNAGPWADGSEWVFQFPEQPKGGKLPEYRSDDGRPHFDIGPFGPVNRMLNELITECPVLLDHGADLGPQSSALFADGFSDADTAPNPSLISTDLEWFVTTSGDRNKIGGMLVNTRDRALSISLSVESKRVSGFHFEQMTFEGQNMATPEVPGEAKAWRLKEGKAADGTLVLPPCSITRFSATRR